MESTPDVIARVGALEAELSSLRAALEGGQRGDVSTPHAQRRRSLPGGHLFRAGLVAAFLVVAVGANAYASIPDANGVIHACYDHGSGNLRIIDPTVKDKHQSQCDKPETALSWSQTGPQGLIGPAGLTWKGQWSSTVTYSKNDAVFDPKNGSAWIAVAANGASEPSSSNAKWSLLAAQGASALD